MTLFCNSSVNSIGQTPDMNGMAELLHYFYTRSRKMSQRNLLCGKMMISSEQQTGCRNYGTDVHRGGMVNGELCNCGCERVRKRR